MNQLFSERFKSARLLNGLSLQDLADKLNNQISRQALHKYAKGEVIPNSEMLNLLCTAMGVRPDFFFRETTVQLGDIEFRKLDKLPAKEENKIIEETKDYISRYLELEEIIGFDSEYINPLAGFPIVETFEDVERATQKLRSVWNLGTNAIANTVELLEDNHIKVIEIEAGDGFDGMQTIVNKKFPVIAINTSRVKKGDRKRFTVLHELGHLVLPIKKDLSEKQKEILCHQFAGSMLFHESAIKKELGIKRQKLLINELGALKQEYGISIQAIVMRAKALDIISNSYYRQFFGYIVQMGWKIDEPFDYSGNEKSRRFDQLLYRALAEELISISKAASLKNMKLTDFKTQSLNVS